MKRKIGLALLILIVLLLLPLLFKDRSHPLAEFRGPELAELEYSEMTFSSSDGTSLSGMLFLPDIPPPYPTAVIIHGSGCSSRDNSWYLAVVRELREKGIAVLLPDKRGCEKSQGDWRGLDVEALAEDTHAAVRWAKDQEQLDPSNIGIVGVSQGGWIAAVVAADSGDLAYAVDISGTLATGEEQLYFEEKNNIAQHTYGFIAQWVSKVTTKNLMEKEHIKPFISFDPAPWWEEVGIPVLIAFGENDTNCPVERSLERIREANGKLNHLRVEVYPDGRHAILNSEKTYLSAEFLEDLTDFIIESAQ